jgi:hypothetical protein
LKHGDEFKDKQNLFQHLAQSLYDSFVSLILVTSYTQIFARGVEPEHPHHEISNLQRVHNVQRTKLGYTCHQAKEQSGMWFLSQFTKNPFVYLSITKDDHTLACGTQSKWDSFLCTYFIYEWLKGLICRTQLKHGSIFCTSVVVKGDLLKLFDTLGFSNILILVFLYVFIGLAYQGKVIVFRLVIEYSSLRDFGP